MKSVHRRFIRFGSNGGMERAADPEGNARLTGLTGAALLVLLAVEGATLLSIRSLVSWHVFVGILLVPLVGLKLVSTGYRFVRYYTGQPAYVHAGPPPILLRLLGPVVVLSTALLFGTGIALAVATPRHGIVLGLHKASFVVWFGAMSVHVLAHLVRIPRLTVPDLRGGGGAAHSTVRLAAVAAAVVVGAVLAVAALPAASHWSHAERTVHHDH